jgi:hypothetical protein
MTYIAADVKGIHRYGQPDLPSLRLGISIRLTFHAANLKFPVKYQSRSVDKHNGVE